MKDVRQTMPVQRREDYMHMVRHHASREDGISLTVKMPQRVCNHFGNFGPCKVASTMPRVQGFIKTPIKIVKPCFFHLRECAPHLLSRFHNVFALKIKLAEKCLGE